MSAFDFESDIFFIAYRYVAPEAAPDAKEKIFIEKAFLADEVKKREIYVFSDVHFGGEWSKNAVDEFKKFLMTMARIAEEYVHTIVMLGDLFEMWMTPITMTPASIEDMTNLWKNDEVRNYSRYTLFT